MHHLTTTPSFSLPLSLQLRTNGTTVFWRFHIEKWRSPKLRTGNGSCSMAPSMPVRRTDRARERECGKKRCGVSLNRFLISYTFLGSGLKGTLSCRMQWMVCPSVRPSIHPSFHTSIHPSVHPSILPAFFLLSVDREHEHCVG